MGILRGNKSTESDANTATPATSWGTAPASGSKVIVWLWGSSTATPTMSDNGSPSRTFTLAASKTDATNTLGVWIFYADDVRPSGTYTVTATFGAAQSFSIGGLAYTGVASGGPETTNNNTGTSTSVSSGAVTGTGVEDLYTAGFVCNSNGPDTVTVGGGFTTQHHLDDGTTFDEGAGVDQIGVTGSQTASWTLSNSRTWSSAIAAWKAAPLIGGYLGFGGDRMKPAKAPGGMFAAFQPFVVLPVQAPAQPPPSRLRVILQAIKRSTTY